MQRDPRSQLLVTRGTNWNTSRSSVEYLSVMKTGQSSGFVQWNVFQIVQPSSSLELWRYLRTDEIGVQNELFSRPCRLKPSESTKDLAHHKVAFSECRYGALLQWCRIHRLFLGRFYAETYAALHSRREESLVERRLAWWLIAVMLTVEPFSHYTPGVGHGSTTSTSNFGMANIVVSCYLLFAF